MVKSTQGGWNCVIIVIVLAYKSSLTHYKSYLIRFALVHIRKIFCHNLLNGAYTFFCILW